MFWKGVKNEKLTTDTFSGGLGFSSEITDRGEIRIVSVDHGFNR